MAPGNCANTSADVLMGLAGGQTHHETATAELH